MQSSLTNLSLLKWKEVLGDHMDHITPESFNSYTSSFDEPVWFSKFRLDSFIAMQRTVMPVYRYGMSILVRPVSFSFSSLVPTLHPDVSVSIKGADDLVVFSGNHMEQVDYADDLRMFLSRDWHHEKEENKLYHFQQAFCNHILFVKIPKGKTLEHPIEITYDVHSGQVYACLFILAEEGAKATVIVNRRAEDAVLYAGETVRVFAHQHSDVKIVTVQEHGNEVVGFHYKKARCFRDAKVEWMDLYTGGQYTRSEITAALMGQGSSTIQKTLCLGRGKSRFDVQTISRHHASHTTCDLLTRAALYDEAKFLSRGLITMGPSASSSKGYEKQDALLLSEHAEANAIPQLEIYNHDVQCSHGSSVGPVDEAQLFYLMSRGLTRVDALRLIVEGYFSPVLSLAGDAVQEHFSALFDRLAKRTMVVSL